MRILAVLLCPLLAGVVACRTAVATRQSETPSWVLVRSPASGDLGIPIYAWERVRMFPTAEECSTYRAELLDNAVSAASRTKLEEVYQLHCVPMTKMVPPR